MPRLAHIFLLFELWACGTDDFRDSWVRMETLRLGLGRDSSEKENGPAMSNSKEAQESFSFLVSCSQDVLERHIVLYPGS